MQCSGDGFDCLNISQISKCSHAPCYYIWISTPGLISKDILTSSNRHHSKNLRNFYGTLNCWSCGSRGRNTKYRIVRSRVWQCLAGGSILISALVRMNGGLGVVQALCCSQHGWVRPQSYCLSRDISAFQTFFSTEDSAASDKNIQSKDDSGQ